MWKVLTVFALCLSAVLCENVKMYKCDETSVGQCLISNVKINPCPEASEDLPCRVKRGRSVAIDFDFKADFDIETYKSQVFWANGNVDLPLVGVDSNGCNYSPCPIPAHTTRNFHWNFDVMKKYPTRLFDVKMKLTSQDTNNFCCFIVKIKLTK